MQAGARVHPQRIGRAVVDVRRRRVHRRRAVSGWLTWVSLVLGVLTTLFAISPLQYMSGTTGPLWLLTATVALLRERCDSFRPRAPRPRSVDAAPSAHSARGQASPSEERSVQIRTDPEPLAGAVVCRQHVAVRTL